MTTPDPQITDVAPSTEQGPVLTGEALVEEVSIDGMCGVY
ncbi:mycofactocin precursor MftA [Nocardioides sp.]